MSDRDKIETILLADDDPDDLHMARKALQKTGVTCDVFTVSDGEELLDFLRHTGKFAPPALSPRPALILLDLNMPKMGGREALAEIKNDESLHRIPVVVMTTSTSEEDIERAYALGGNSFISKPITLGELAEIMRVLARYWLKIVRIPGPR